MDADHAEQYRVSELHRRGYSQVHDIPGSWQHQPLRVLGVSSSISFADPLGGRSQQRIGGRVPPAIARPAPV